MVRGMASPSQRDLGAFSTSPYAAELQRGAAVRAFSPKVEAEYVRAHLADNRTLIRLTATLAVVLGLFRGLEQTLLDTWVGPQPLLVALVLVVSFVLAVVSWTPPLFARLYLPVAQVVVPIRGALIAVGIAHATSAGQLELLMLLPLMVVGPFFFMGLRFRVALVAVAVTLATFAIAAVALGLAPSMAARAFVFLLITAGACSLAARHVEKWSRTSFLKSHLIAELAQHDTLTGLKNRRVFDEHLDQLWERAVDDGRALAILMIDIDHFKAYNDRYGHQAGDHALRRVAQALQPLVTRPLDVLARYGGEEFAVIMYDVDGRQAEAVAERMRVVAHELRIEHHESQAGGAVTISVGVAAIEPTPERRSRGALQLADQALYEAKVRGRNRVELKDDVAHRLLVTGVFAKSSLTRH
jgi:diguanylate cyclase (GGDEF)-like protein